MKYIKRVLVCQENLDHKICRQENFVYYSNKLLNIKSPKTGSAFLKGNAFPTEFNANPYIKVKKRADLM
jgi:hypothetical protein